MNMCFELYFLARSKNEETVSIVAALLVLMQNVYIFFSVSLDAAYVTEEATKGVDILRSHGMDPDDSIYRKYLVLTLIPIISTYLIIVIKLC